MEGEKKLLEALNQIKDLNARIKGLENQRGTRTGTRIPPLGAEAQITSGTLAARPAASTADDYYWATDISTLFRDTGAAWEVAGSQYYKRTIVDSLTNLSYPGSDSMEAAGRVWLSPIEITRTLTVDRIGWKNFGTITGNFRAGIYNDGAAGDTPALAALIIESASVAGTGTQRKQEVTIANTRLTPGLYWLAIQGDQSADTIGAVAWNITIAGTLRGYCFDNAGGYGAFENPQASALIVDVRSRCLYVRVASIP